jgi:hypothetical protein
MARLLMGILTGLLLILATPKSVVASPLQDQIREAKLILIGELEELTPPPPSSPNEPSQPIRIAIIKVLKGPKLSGEIVVDSMPILSRKGVVPGPHGIGALNPNFYTRGRMFLWLLNERNGAWVWKGGNNKTYNVRWEAMAEYYLEPAP